MHQFWRNIFESIKQTCSVKKENNKSQSLIIYMQNNKKSRVELKRNRSIPQNLQKPKELMQQVLQERKK